MKKSLKDIVLVMVMCVVMVITAIPVTAFGTQVSADKSLGFEFTNLVNGEKITYSCDKDGIMTVSGKGTALISGTEIEAEFTEHKSEIKKIVFEEGITEVWEGFNNCENLTEVELPKSLIKILDNAFASDVNLQSVTFPSSIKSATDETFISNNAFKGCVKLNEITIPEGMDSVFGGAFSECGLKNVYLPRSLCYLDDDVFNGNPEDCIYHVYKDSYADLNFDNKFIGIREYIDNSERMLGDKIVKSFSTDKKIMSEGETATITVEMADGYTAKWIHFYKPITKNKTTIYLQENGNGKYTGTFKVTDQTESGIWQVDYLVYIDKNDNISFLYNSITHSETGQDKTDFSNLDFEVIGTNADITKPVILSYEIDKKIISLGETISFEVIVEDEHPSERITFWYKKPSGDMEFIRLDKDGYKDKEKNQVVYNGVLNVTEETESGNWKPYWLNVGDTNGNTSYIYNTKIYGSTNHGEDMSKADFEVIDPNQSGSTDDKDSYIVIFKDGKGNTLSTQRVTKGEAAVEPEAPTDGLYLFDGWDSDFNNITSDMVISAKWRLNPDVKYDRDIHVGESFKIEVYSQSSQYYTITCNEDVDFTSELISSGFTFTDKMYYHKEYEINVKTPGSYIFYVKGNLASNTLNYKVRINDHNWEKEYIVDVKPTCDKTGSKSIHCKVCDVIKEDTKKTVAALGHDWNKEFTLDKQAACETSGSKSQHCKRCAAKRNETEIAPLGHKTRLINVEKATCVENGYSGDKECTVCNQIIEEGNIINAFGHNYTSVVTKPTNTQKGYTTHRCENCGDSYVDSYVEPLLFKNNNIVRYAGKGRYETAMLAADGLKQSLGVSKFENVIVACGDNYPDALTGSYLAKVKKSPILLVNMSTDYEKSVKNYIAKNLKSGGTVYILGGEGAVSKRFEKSLSSFNVKRLAGDNRYDTNIAILKEAGVSNEDLLICTGSGFADSLSASAAGKPILLAAGSGISRNQTKYLKSLSKGNIYLIGGEGAVSNKIGTQLKAYDKDGKVERVSGVNRYKTSTAVAKKFFPGKCEAAVFAYAHNFPDGLSGGPLAMSIGSPLILTDNAGYAEAKTYLQTAGISKAIVLGGESLISDKTVNGMIN